VEGRGRGRGRGRERDEGLFAVRLRRLRVQWGRSRDRGVSGALARAHTRAYMHALVTRTAEGRRGRKGYSRSRTTANCQVPSRTTNNRKCSHNNADMRRWQRRHARALASTREHSRALASPRARVCACAQENATQISSAIMPSALVNARGPSSSIPARYSASRSENRSDPPRVVARGNFKCRVHQQDYPRRVFRTCRNIDSVLRSGRHRHAIAIVNRRAARRRARVRASARTTPRRGKWREFLSRGTRVSQIPAKEKSNTRVRHREHQVTAEMSFVRE